VLNYEVILMWISRKKFEQLEKMLDAFTEKIDKYNISVTETNNRIKSLDIDLRDFVTDFKKTIMPIYNAPEKQFKPKDKALYDEEQKEFTNLAIG